MEKKILSSNLELSSFQNKILTLLGEEAIKDSKLIESIVNLYAKVFAGPPWNEFCRCSCCNKFYGQEQSIGLPSPCCSESLIEAYPLAETSDYIIKELAEKNALLTYLVNFNNEIFGFAWGYQSTPQQFAGEKYQTQEMRQTIINLLNSAGLHEELPIYYFSECGVEENNRGKGCANILTQEIIETAKFLGLPLLMRTNCQSPMVAVAQKFGMKQFFGPEMIYQNSQIITTERIINGTDLENPNRVLFIKIY
jgi:hypothetical protein